ncbi:MAG: cwlD [Clostridia bacterium]|nr:cwlD [Clostridia bacterium]
MKVYIVNRRLMSRIMYRIMLLVIFAVIFSYASQDAIGTASLPIKNMVVIIDAGHGGRDNGAIGVTGKEEDNINLKIALKLRRLIEQAGGVALMIREDDTGLYDETKRTGRKLEDLQNRMKIFSESEADIILSIHLNSFPQGQYYGAQTFYKDGDASSRKLAEYIQEELLAVIDRGNNRKIKPKSDIYIFKGNNITGALVECGFLSNPEEEQLLTQDHYQERIAWSVFSGIVKYFEEEQRNLTPQGEAEK